MSTPTRPSSSRPTAATSNSLTASAARHARVDRDIEMWRRQRDAEYQQARAALDSIFVRGGVIPRIRG